MDIKEIVDLWIETKDDRYFTQIHKRLYKGMYHHVLNIVRDDIVTEDILSETFASIVQNITQYDPSRGQFTTWAYNIARNAAFHYLKKERQQDELRERGSPSLYTIYGNSAAEPLDEENLEDEPGYIDFHDISDQPALNREELFVKLHQLAIQEIMNLSEVYRQCMYEREVLGLSYEEIADRNELKINTVKSKIRLGREIVKYKLLEFLGTLQQ